MRIINILFLLILMLQVSGCAQKQEKILIKTTYGNIKIKLYDDTPLHRDNFIKLVSSGYYDGLLFHRVINEFMIQGGDPNSRDALLDAQLGNGDPGYKINAEIIYPKHFHKKGALAAARQGDQANPQKKSSGSQFYIVQGKVFTSEELDQLEKVVADQQRQTIMMKYMNQHRETFIRLQQAGDNAGIQELMDKLLAESTPEIEALKPFKIPEEHRAVYTSIGGTPALDNEYTVFGEVEEGLDVIDAIATLETNDAARPLKNVTMSIMVIKE